MTKQSSVEDSTNDLSPSVERDESSESVLTERLSSIDGSRIALFSNTKIQSDVFLENVGEYIKDAYDVEVSEVYAKSGSTSPAADDLIEELIEYDAVIIAYGDCGSCSSWTVHDAISIEKLGVPTVVFTSNAFSSLAQIEAENQDCPELPILEFQHPIADLSEEEIRSDRITDELLGEVIDVLTMQPDEIEATYKGKYSESA